MLAVTSLLDIIASPFVVFDRIHRQRLSGWLPFGLIMLAIALVFGWYFYTVDFYSFLETSMTLSGKTVDPEELETILQQESVIRGISLFSAVIGAAVIYLILALYFYLAALLVAEEKLSFGVLFALVCWASVPSLLSVISTAVSYAIAQDYIYLAFLDKTSLVNISGSNLSSPHFDLYSSISVGGIWSYALYGVGFYRVMRCSVTTACIVAVIPLLIQLGLVVIF